MARVQRSSLGTPQHLVLVLVLLACAAAAVQAQQQPQPAAEAGEHSAAREQREAAANYWKWTHAVLMSVAWIGLLPLGALLSQSRWASPMKTEVVGKQAWFWSHLAINSAGVALVIAAFAIACSDSSHMDIKPDDGSVEMAHKVLGSIVFALLLLQVVLGFVRPHPGARLRGLWNHFHHNFGRFVLLAAWTVVWLGVAIYEEGVLLHWVVPIAVFQGVLLLVYLAGCGIRNRAVHEQNVEARHQRKLAAENGGAHPGQDGQQLASRAAFGTTTNGSAAHGMAPAAPGVNSGAGPLGAPVYGSSIRTAEQAV